MAQTPLGSSATRLAEGKQRGRRVLRFSPPFSYSRDRGESFVWSEPNRFLQSCGKRRHLGALL